MKKIIFLFVLLAHSYSFAQSTGLVYYGHIESLSSGTGLDLNAYLQFDEKQSYYVTAKDSLEDQLLIESQKSKLSSEENRQIHLGVPTLAQGRQVYYQKEKDSLWWNTKYNNPVYGKEKRPAIQWKLINESRQIGNLSCKKATTTFRGRNYTAWYASDIPVPYGPWKFQGLPGLILEVYDDDKALHIYFKSVEYPSQKNTSLPFIKKPLEDKNIAWISIDAYQALLKDKVEKNKTKAILLEKEFGIGIQAGEMRDISVEIFE